MLPDHTPVGTQTLQAIAKRHGLDGTITDQIPDTGIFNAIYHVGGLGQDAILRAPRHHSDVVAHGYREAVVAPAARAAEVRTPMLPAFDDSLELLPAPYTTYDGDDPVEARFVRGHLDLRLGMLSHGAVLGRSWAERPLPMLPEVLRFFLDPPNDRWRAVGQIATDDADLSSASLARSGGVAHV